MGNLQCLNGEDGLEPAVVSVEEDSLMATWTILSMEIVSKLFIISERTPIIITEVPDMGIKVFFQHALHLLTLALKTAISIKFI